MELEYSSLTLKFIYCTINLGEFIGKEVVLGSCLCLKHCYFLNNKPKTLLLNQLSQNNSVKHGIWYIYHNVPWITYLYI